MVRSSKALFYDAELSTSALRDLVRRVGGPPEIDQIVFPEPSGGDVFRDFAVPLLIDTDGIEIETARIAFHAVAGERELQQDKYDVVTHDDADNQGIELRLAQPQRIKRIRIGGIPKKKDGDPTLHVIVRPEGPLDANNDPTFTAPTFADFTPPSGMFSMHLGKLDSPSNGQATLNFSAGLDGSAWLIQLATLDDENKRDPTTLKPVEFKGNVISVTVEAMPTNTSLAAFNGGEPVAVWAHPGPLRVEEGEQVVSFAPVTQNELAAKLKAAKASGSTDLTLPIRLKFHADSGGKLGVTENTIAARYFAKPLAAPTVIRLGGTWTPLTFNAPAGLRVEDATMRVTAKLLGRELNAGSAEAPMEAPSSGLRVDASRWASAAVSFVPPAAGPATLVSARLHLAAMEKSEGVLELRADAAHLPGQPLAPPVVLQIEKGTADSYEFLFAAPIELQADSPTPLWLMLRTTRGQVLWFNAPAEMAVGGIDLLPADPIRVSIDAGKTWSRPERPIADAAPLCAQLFHASAPTASSVRGVRMRVGPSIVSDDLLAQLAPAGEREYTARAAAVPSKLLTAFAATPGVGRPATLAHVFSRAVMDVTIDDLTLYYDPAQGG